MFRALLLAAFIALSHLVCAQSKAPRELVTLFFAHSNAKDCDKYSQLFSNNVSQYFLVANTNKQTVYSKAWAWFKAHPDEHYAPDFNTFTEQNGSAEIVVEYYRDGVPIKPYKMLFGFDGSTIDAVRMQKL